MTFTERYDAVCMMHDYFKRHPHNNSRQEIMGNIADRFGLNPNRCTFSRLKDDMCHIFHCLCIFNQRTNSYSLIHHNVYSN